MEMHLISAACLKATFAVFNQNLIIHIEIADIQNTESKMNDNSSLKINSLSKQIRFATLIK